jgi:uncharacterized protein YdeI (YjbR/CyaY-like superfamily)
VSLPTIAFASRAEWAAWLADHHDDIDGLWVKFAKKDSGIDSVTYAEAVEVALCYGWIDGQAAAHDDAHWLQRFTPRRARSRWSKINRDRARALIEGGEMQPAGMREVERAKADGRWDAAYEGARAATVPDDLQAALDADGHAREFFATLDSANRYAILYRLDEAKKPETRERRLRKFVTMLESREKIH